MYNEKIDSAYVFNPFMLTSDYKEFLQLLSSGSMISLITVEIGMILQNEFHQNYQAAFGCCELKCMFPFRNFDFRQFVCHTATANIC